MARAAGAGSGFRDLLYAMHRADPHTTLRYDMARTNLDCEAAQPSPPTSRPQHRPGRTEPAPPSGGC